MNFNGNMNFNMDMTVARLTEVPVVIEVEVNGGRLEIVTCVTISPRGKEKNFPLSEEERDALVRKAHDRLQHYTSK